MFHIGQCLENCFGMLHCSIVHQYKEAVAETKVHDVVTDINVKVVE